MQGASILLLNQRTFAADIFFILMFFNCVKFCNTYYNMFIYCITVSICVSLTLFWIATFETKAQSICDICTDNTDSCLALVEVNIDTVMI
jgi:hypothetical protein